MRVFELFENNKIGEEKKSLRNTNPCWKGYHPVGTKKKNGRTVPNCVPTNEDDAGTKFTGYWKGKDKRTPGKHMVGENNIDMFETALNPKDPKGDYEAKRKALHDLSLDKNVDQKMVQQRRLDLDKEAKAKGIIK